MARIPLEPARTTPLIRAVKWYCRRVYGRTLDPVTAFAHNRRVLIASSRLEMSVARWKELDPGLKALAVMASAASVGCSWCMDFGYWEHQRHGVPAEKLREVPRWRSSDVYTPLERDVMEYAEAMTVTPPVVSDELAERLRGVLGDAGVVELTAVVGVENSRSRVNAALGLTSQGFKETCDVPLGGGA